MTIPTKPTPTMEKCWSISLNIPNRFDCSPWFYTRIGRIIIFPIGHLPFDVPMPIEPHPNWSQKLTWWTRILPQAVVKEAALVSAAQEEWLGFRWPIFWDLQTLDDSSNDFMMYRWYHYDDSNNYGWLLLMIWWNHGDIIINIYHSL